jgi:hypothetical protein
MAERTDTNVLAAAWRALAGAGGGEGWKTIPIGNNEKCPILAGRRTPTDDEAILVGFGIDGTLKETQLPQGRGFALNKLQSDPTGGNKLWLALVRRSGASSDLFAMMGDDVVQLVEKNAHAPSATVLQRFLARISAWQEFMDRRSIGVLSEEAEVGLFGELVVLEALLSTALHGSAILDAWRGPLDNAHDFILGSGAVEVKTTLSSSQRHFSASISSLEQLDDSLRTPLFVAAVSLVIADNGTSLPEMASLIRQRLLSEESAADVFELRLIQAGLLPHTSNLYTRRFRTVSVSYMRVQQNFPRLIRANVHSAVRSARYEIAFDIANAEQVDLLEALRLIGVV